MFVRAVDDKPSDTLVVVSDYGFWTGSSTLPHLHHFLVIVAAACEIVRDMPIPKVIARFNLLVTNRITGRFAGRLPLFAIVRHVGRKSGRELRTPVNIFKRGDRYVVALTYGADAQWVRNVLAAGGCEIEVNGKLIRLADPRLYVDPKRRDVPVLVRVVLRAIGVDEFLELRPVEEAGAP